MTYLLRKIRFFFERAFLEGSWNQLLLVAFVVALVTLTGGTSAYLLTDQFQTLESALWWAFLRLTDSGYLGDDQGLTLRAISTLLTINGYVLFLGTLVALMTQWMWRMVRSLEEGRTPLAINGHIIIAGLDERTPELIREMLLSDERLNLFLRKVRRSKLTVVVLTSKPGVEATQFLKAELGELWKNGQVIVRFGRASDPDDLKRVDITNASVVLVPQVIGGQGDARTSTILAAINHSIVQSEKPSPLIVCEFNNDTAFGVLKAFPKLVCEPVFSNATITKILAQSVKHAGLAQVFMELLSHRDGHEIYIKDFSELVGKSWGEAETYFHRALPIGLLRKIDQKHELVFDSNTVISDSDRPLFMSQEMKHIEIIDKSSPRKLQTTSKTFEIPPPSMRNVLIIGPSNKANELMRELQDYRDFKPSVVVTTSFEDQGLEQFDKIILLPFPDHSIRADEVDQHTIHTYFKLRAKLNEIDHHLDILVELASPTAAEAFALEARCDVIVPALISSHLLAHIGLRRDLAAVFEEVLGPTGADMTLYAPSSYGINEQTTMSFAQMRELVRPFGHVLIGLRIALDEDRHKRKIELAPKPDATFKLSAHDRFIVLN